MTSNSQILDEDNCQQILSSEKKGYTGEYSSESTKEFSNISVTDSYWPSTKTGKYTHDGDRGNTVYSLC